MSETSRVFIKFVNLLLGLFFLVDTLASLLLRQDFEQHFWAFALPGLLIVPI
jgi:hypothetical protein